MGFFTDVGASYFLTHLFPDQPEIALFLGLTGAKIKGIDNVNCGTATHFIPHDRLNDFKKEIIRNFSEEGKDITYDKVLEFVDKFAEKKYEKKHFIFINHLQIKKVFKAGLSVVTMYNTLLNMIEKSEDDERNWAKNMLFDLRSKSPLSLIVENELLNRGFSFTSYQEAIQSDIEISTQFTEESDFLEGIRALLIDKDKKPKWKFDLVEDITKEKQQEIINFFFKKPSFNTTL
jgi:enoyl-CoA hydratase/carnithine racemase